MSMIERSVAGAGVMALGWMLGGCSAANVSAGSEGDAVNLGRCYGADCGSKAQSLTLERFRAESCGDVDGALEDRLTFEPMAPGVQAEALEAKQAPDGSVWAIQTVSDFERGDASLYLTHHSREGTLLGVSGAIGSQGEHEVLNSALALGAGGVVTVAVYSNYAATSDSELVERLTLYSFDEDLTPVGEPRAFRGMATPHMATGALGSIWLAGNATNNAPHGTISRITSGAPDWIQTAVPTSGQSVGGVSGVTVGDDGFAAVLAQLNPKWSGSGPNVAQLGVSTFDSTGKPVWTLALPTDYTQGYGGGLGTTAEGDLVVAGVVGDQGDELLVQGLSRDGELSWSYQIPQPMGPDIDVRRASGRVFVATRRGLAVIDPAGTSCRQFSGGASGPRATIDAPSDAQSAPWRADADYIFAVGREMTRFRVPE
jgi:hypothetical protein